jgi:hypothetical protein
MIDALTYIDEKDNYYVTYHQKNDTPTNILSEIFILIPLKDSSRDPKTLVIFMTNIDIGLDLPYCLRQMVKEERLNILSNFKRSLEYNEYNLTNLNELMVKLPKVKRKSTRFNDEQLISFTENKILIEDREGSDVSRVDNL